jgi:NAD(P)-dependent dehydrogenase (short-subunit alcohol dehydrogenase family)
VTGAVLVVDGGWQCFNQPGDAHPPVTGTPSAELAAPEPVSKARIVVVTGGARGIGAAIAERFAAAGDTVVVADKDGERAAELVSALGAGHLAFTLDVASECEVQALFAAVRQRFGRLDVLVNGAALADSFGPMLEQSAADLDTVLEVNVVGAFLCAREAIKLMGGGVVLNLGSINSFLPFAPRHAAGASTAAIDMLTRCMAAELGPAGVRTATLAPGYIRTPGSAALEASGHIDSTRIRRRVPLGRFGEPAEIANAAFFLASSEASYINGSILHVDGGWTAFGDAGDASTE